MNNEKADMHLIYGPDNGNGRTALKLYHETFPNRCTEKYNMFAVHRFTKVPSSCIGVSVKLYRETYAKQQICQALSISDLKVIIYETPVD